MLKTEKTDSVSLVHLLNIIVNIRLKMFNYDLYNLKVSKISNQICLLVMNHVTSPLFRGLKRHALVKYTEFTK